MRHPLILVVDDDLAVSRLLWLTLTEAGFEVITAFDGEEALDRIGDRVPDAIVLDLEMPTMDGRTFYRALRSSARVELREVPVLILSAYGARRARRELGASAAVEKPFVADRLLALITDLIELPEEAQTEAGRWRRG